MPNFRFAPHCAFVDLALLEPNHMGGTAIATWIGMAPDGLIDIDAGELRRRGHAVEVGDNGAGLYAIRREGSEPTRYQVNYRDGVVEFEDDHPSIELDEFLRSSVRVTPNGRFICSFVEPLFRQLQKCNEVGTDGALHRQDLSELTQHRQSEGFSAGVGLYDIVATGLTDEVPAVQQFLNMVQGRRLTEVSGLFRQLDDLGVPQADWNELKDSPAYQIDQVRALFRHLLSRYVEDRPIERILRLETDDADTLIASLDEAAELISVDPPFNVGNFIRGYSTSEVRHYRAGGADVIVFNDPMGAYAYAWPSPPVPTDEPAAPGL